MGSIRQAIIIVAEQPASAPLMGPLSADDTASLAEALLTDTVRIARDVGCADVVIAFSPPSAESWFEAQFPGVPRIAQRGGELGDRLAAITSEAWKLRYRPCVFIDANCPDLPADRIRTTFDSLQPGSETDVVICPSHDGGYCLIGIGGPYGSLFRHIAWSGAKILRDTLTRAEECELKVDLLPPWPEVETVEDLSRLCERLQAAATDVAPAMRAWIEAHPNAWK